MKGLVKFIIGAIVASLLAWGAHSLSGASYVDRMEAEGRQVLKTRGFDGVTLEMIRDPLSRVAVLSGVSDLAKRAEIEAALLASGRIRAVRWADPAALASSSQEASGSEEASGNAAMPDPAALATGIEDAEATTGASEEQVLACQSGIDTVMEGKTITFASGSAVIGQTSLGLIGNLADLLNACTGMTVAVSGHTDATGSAQTNLELSQARADAVVAALTERGVGSARISATGYGSSQPIVAGDGANEANRRIEFDLSTGPDTGADRGAEEGE
ncbi:MAG: OmpA family protein [Pseudomonadota bacterium]